MAPVSSLATGKRVGRHTIAFQNPPVVLGAASVVGPKEGQGPLGSEFDIVMPDNLGGEETWEKAEQKMLKEASLTAITAAGLKPPDIDYMLAGDLLNQIISSNFTARDLAIPFIGLYGACSTMYEGISIGSILVEGGYADYVLAAACSHYDTAERQFRFPTEMGVQRPLSAQWTVTGAGAVVIGSQGRGPVVTHVTIGQVVDMGINDPNDMGSAMAPAAADTLIKHFQDTGRRPSEYDLIIGGDLANIGRALTQQLVSQAGYDMSGNYTDCGILIYDPAQDTHAGGSGCGCSAVVLAGHLLKEMNRGRLKRILAFGTGALMSPTSSLQGDSIPGIAHAVVLDGFNTGG